MPAEPSESPVASARERVDKAKARIRDIQSQLPQAKADAQTGMRGGWQAYTNLKKNLVDALAVLAEAKTELVRLCGTTGTDPKWELLAKAWVVLTRLDEGDADIGQLGRDVVADIEFHVSASKLQKAIEDLSGSEQSAAAR